MMPQMIWQTIAAALGTVSFAVLYGVPDKFFRSCGLIGGTGWLLYALLTKSGWTAAAAAFLASLTVVFLSRAISVRERCPSTVFIISGIFPLVPGVGVYWTAYYLVTDQLSEALQSGFDAMKIAVSITLGITVMLEAPNRWFHFKLN